MSAWLGLGPAEMLGLLLVYFIGGLVKGGSGFGLPLVTISMSPFIVPIDLALAVNAVVLPFANVYQYGRSGLAKATLMRFWPILLGLLLGVPIGALFVNAIEPAALTMALGLFILAFVGLSVVNPRIAVPGDLERPAGAATGFIAGIVGALTTANGPLFVIYLVGRGVERQMMVATLGLCFLVFGVLVSGSFWAIGLLDAQRFLLALLCVAPVLVGVWAGDAWGARLPQATFRRFILVLLFLLGANMLARTAFAM
ncbi:sulfite exporter TauE/SafE family protein [Afifella pfennigii]|uniref:sulfite exporter TauE/SafE family protein n=1 Tax=Afifella pfennigii TaxID=209897 RepID=UPI00047AD908|nr:sulfite exporter TauE/SafE family protein [Afifella pfennigii]